MKKTAAILALAAAVTVAAAITVSWRDCDPNVTGYEIWRSTNLAVGFTFWMQTNIPGGNFTNSVTVPARCVLECFKVRALNSNDGTVSDWATR